jgi:hypothetical protein
MGLWPIRGGFFIPKALGLAKATILDETVML